MYRQGSTTNNKGGSEEEIRKIRENNKE